MIFMTNNIGHFITATSYDNRKYQISKWHWRPWSIKFIYKAHKYAPFISFSKTNKNRSLPDKYAYCENGNENDQNVSFFFFFAKIQNASRLNSDSVWR